MATVLGIAAPILGGWALVTSGPTRTFLGVGAIQLLAALPLIGTPDVPVLDAAADAFRDARPGLLLRLAEGLFASGFYFTWQLALFIALGENFAKYGGAVALAGLTGSIGGLVLGRHVDAGHGRRAILLTYGLIVAVVALRTGSLSSPLLAVAANAAGAFASALVMPTMLTALYNLAKASPCPLRFSVVSEGAWDIGCAAGCLIAAGCSWAGMRLSLATLVALPGVVGLVRCLWRYYGPRDVSGRASTLAS
jgi:hypothetical protein